MPWRYLLEKTRRKIDFKTKRIRYVYMLSVDNFGKKSRFYGFDYIYYVGQTNDLGSRLINHLNGVNSNFLARYFKDALIRLVFVKYVLGTEWDAILEEKRIKRFSKKKKEELVKSNKNMLVGYRLHKGIILKKFGSDCEECVIKLV